MRRLLAASVLLISLTSCAADPNLVQLTFDVKDSTVVVKGLTDSAGQEALLGYIIGIGGLLVAIVSLLISSWQGKRNAEAAERSVKLAERSVQVAEDTITFEHQERAAVLRAGLYSARLDVIRHVDTAIQKIVQMISRGSEVAFCGSPSVSNVMNIGDEMNEYWLAVAEAKDVLPVDLLEILTIKIPDALLPFQSPGEDFSAPAFLRVMSKIVELSSEFSKKSRELSGLEALGKDIEQAINSSSGNRSLQ